MDSGIQRVFESQKHFGITSIGQGSYYFLVTKGILCFCGIVLTFYVIIFAINCVFPCNLFKVSNAKLKKANSSLNDELAKMQKTFDQFEEEQRELQEDLFQAQKKLLELQSDFKSVTDEKCSLDNELQAFYKRFSELQFNYKSCEQVFSRITCFG